MKIGLFAQLRAWGFASTEFQGCLSGGTGCGLLTFGDTNVRELRLDLVDMAGGRGRRMSVCTLTFPKHSICLFTDTIFLLSVNICLLCFDPFLYTGSSGFNQIFTKLLPVSPAQLQE